MIYFLFLPKNGAKNSRFYPKVGAKHPFSIFPGVSVYRCHLPLKDELVISIDDNGLDWFYCRESNNKKKAPRYEAPLIRFNSIICLYRRSNYITTSVLPPSVQS